MSEERQIINVETEDGKVVEAELLDIVNIDGKEYACLSIFNDDLSTSYLAFYVEKDEEGYDDLVSIDNDEDREKIKDFMKSRYLED